jgi:hypothetical protein
MRIDWPLVLRGAGFAGIEIEARTEWHDLWIRIYRTAPDLGDDALLADLQDEARHRLPVADLIRRVPSPREQPAHDGEPRWFPLRLVQNFTIRFRKRAHTTQ